jgi:hypothetical protein
LQDIDRPDLLEGMNAPFQRVSFKIAKGFVRRQHSRRLPDLVFGDPGQLFHFIQGKGFDMLAEFLEADRPFGHEFGIVQLLLDQDFDNPHGQNPVALGSGAEPQIGSFGRVDLFGIHNHQFGSS